MNPLQQVQEDVVAMLLANPATAVVPVKSFRKYAIESAIDEALAGWQVRVPGKIGVQCLVLMPGCRAVYPNVPGPQLEMTLTVLTFEDPKINNTTLSCEDVALENLRWLDGLIIDGLTEIYAEREAEPLAPNYDYPGQLVYETRMVGRLPQNALGRTIAPTLAEADGVATLSCVEDPGAEIYYTLDGSAPIPSDPAALGDGVQTSTQVYTVPFAVTPGTRVRAIACNPPLLPSHIYQADIN